MKLDITMKTMVLYYEFKMRNLENYDVLPKTMHRYTTFSRVLLLTQTISKLFKKTLKRPKDCVRPLRVFWAQLRLTDKHFYLADCMAELWTMAGLLSLMLATVTRVCSKLLTHLQFSV